MRIGAWDLLKGWTGKSDIDLEPRVALQMVNESSLCINRVRRKSSLGHQGFQLVNGMGRLITDEQAHLLMQKHTMEQTRELLVNLGMQRHLSGHYTGETVAVDPHRIISKSKRIMTKKRKDPSAPSQKMLQTFFSVCAETGQPIMAEMASTGMPTTKATSELLNSTGRIIKPGKLLLADKEHFTCELFEGAKQNRNFDLLAPALNTARIQKIIRPLSYKPLWAGFAIAETMFKFDSHPEDYRLIAQRTGETQENYQYNAFLSTSTKDAELLICKLYDQRWTIEEFFRFENDMGMNRASTLNLNIRYAKLAFSMIAQAATYQLRKKLKQEYRTWNARHLANEVLAWADGDIRVEEDTIYVTFYGRQKHLDINDYVNLPQILQKEGINPKIPWLFDYKLDFRFK
ncbi:MAG: transposase [Bacteroidales bacterium]|nr:transposase [Bacteroidales bacterium]